MTIDPERAEAAPDDLAGGVFKRLGGAERKAGCLQTEAEPLTKGCIVAALLASPLAGSDLDLRRDCVTGRVIDL